MEMTKIYDPASKLEESRLLASFANGGEVLLDSGEKVRVVSSTRAHQPCFIVESDVETFPTREGKVVVVELPFLIEGDDSDPTAIVSSILSRLKTNPVRRGETVITGLQVSRAELQASVERQLKGGE